MVIATLSGLTWYFAGEATFSFALRIFIAVLVIAVSLLLVDKFALRDPALHAEADAGATDKSVAVLPFVAMSGGPDDEYFADGMTEEILNSLARFPDLLVTARTSAFAFKGLDISIPEIATKLGVEHVVEGSVRRAGDHRDEWLLLRPGQPQSW